MAVTKIWDFLTENAKVDKYITNVCKIVSIYVRNHVTDITYKFFFKFFGYFLKR